MSDLMQPLSFGHLMSWALEELARDGSIFGVKESQFWHPEPGRLITDPFGDRLASPVGPAAGPQTGPIRTSRRSTLTMSRGIAAKTPGLPSLVERD